MVWNPVRGCTRVSAGCDNRYAILEAHRKSGLGGAYHGLTKRTPSGLDWTGKVRCLQSYLNKQAAQIRDKTGCSEVSFRVASEKGKLKLKAKPVKS